MKKTSVMGRPKIGVSRQVKITLPEWDWVEIEQSIDKSEYPSLSAYFRELHERNTKEEKQRV